MSALAFEFGAWVPYWTQTDGIPATVAHLNQLTSVGPFAYEVQSDGTLADKSGLQNSTAWNVVFQKVATTTTQIIPTMLWNRTEEIRSVLSDDTKRSKNIDAIMAVALDSRFAGVDIDYENKRPEDMAIFSKFLTELSSRLHAHSKILSCTVEPRTTDAPPGNYSDKQLMPWANDFAVLNAQCDEVRLMSYDEYFLQTGTNSWISPTLALPFLSSNTWVDSTIKYALKYITPSKLVLGVPTYGYEFSYKKTNAGYLFDRIKALGFVSAQALRRNYGLTRQYIHNEIHFSFTYNKQKRFVTYSDAYLVGARVKLAKQYGLRGIYIFKVDGTEDPAIWSLEY